MSQILVLDSNAKGASTLTNEPSLNMEKALAGNVNSERTARPHVPSVSRREELGCSLCTENPIEVKCNSSVRGRQGVGQ